MRPRGRLQPPTWDPLSALVHRARGGSPVPGRQLARSGRQLARWTQLGGKSEPQPRPPVSPQHVEGLRAQAWMARPGAASGLGPDPALGSAARVGNGGQRAPQERRAGPELDLADPQLRTLFQKTSPRTCLPSPRDLGSPWSRHVPGVLTRATVALRLSGVQCAARLSRAERTAGELVRRRPRQSGAPAWGLQGAASRPELSSQGSPRCARGRSLWGAVHGVGGYARS